jgi:hypothetical protein
MFIARDSTGNTVFIQDVKEVNKYYCIDDTCNAELILRNRIPRKIRKYYAHKGNQPCKGNLETYIHKACKAIVKKSSYIFLPGLGKVEYDKAIVEQRISGLQPDVKLNTVHGTIALEFWVTKKKDNDTIKKHHSQKMRVFELNLSTLDYSTDEGTLMKIVIDQLDSKNELFPSLEIAPLEFESSIPNNAIQHNINTIPLPSKSVSWEEIVFGLAAIFIIIRFLKFLFKRLSY